MKTIIYNKEGKKSKEIELPSFFNEKIREDIVSKVLEAKKTKQPYGPSPVAGKQHSASGNIQHTRGVWKTMQGKGISRVPRKIMSRRGSQFNWEGAEIPNARGGRRAHPPKVESMINTKKINKKEMLIAIKSALSACANLKFIKEKYKTLTDKKIDLIFPIIVESSLLKLKIKEFYKTLENILGKELLNVSVRKKKIRAGKGKLRGRRYKRNAGLLLVIGKDENFKTGLFEIKRVNSLSVSDLAKGGLGRIVVFTENSIKELETRLKNESNSN
jgi:large subunit ribosomal protein L4e